MAGFVLPGMRRSPEEATGKTDSVQVFNYDPHHKITDGLTLGQLIDAGYKHFKGHNEGPPPHIPEPADCIGHESMIYSNGQTLATLTLTYGDEVGTYFNSNDPSTPIQDIVFDSIGPNSTPITIGKLTIAKIDPKTGTLEIGKNLDAFMYLSQAASIHAMTRFGGDPAALMIARPGLIRILNHLGLEFQKIEGLNLNDQDPQVSAYMDFYPRYWRKTPPPSVYYTHASTILEATTPYINSPTRRIASHIQLGLGAIASSLIS